MVKSVIDSRVPLSRLNSMATGGPGIFQGLSRGGFGIELEVMSLTLSLVWRTRVFGEIQKSLLKFRGDGVRDDSEASCKFGIAGGKQMGFRYGVYLLGVWIGF